MKRMLAFREIDGVVQPIYCNEMVKVALPFEHGRVKIIEGRKFSAHVEDGKTIVTLKPGAGASTEPMFKCPYPSKVKEAIQGLRAAASARIHQMIAEGEYAYCH